MYFTLLIIGATALISILSFSNRNLFEKLVFSPYMIRNRRQGYRFLSHALVHADWIHLLVNMFVLFSFGEFVETAFKLYFGLKGMYFYALLYVGGIALSSTPSYAKHLNDVYYRAVGDPGLYQRLFSPALSCSHCHPSGSLFFRLTYQPLFSEPSIWPIQLIWHEKGTTTSGMMPTSMELSLELPLH